MKRTGSARSEIRIEKKTIRRLFYFGSFFGIALLVVALTILYTRIIHQEFDIKIQQLHDVILHEKKLFLRNAVLRTIQLIEFEHEQVQKEYTGTSISSDQIQELCRQRIQQRLHRLRLTDGGYIWINRIINYNGGAGYAIRIIHPNLPHTEAMLLSTEFTDEQGNQPYKEELEGISRNGELYYQYLFKKMNSDTIARKMSYAKLYKPFDWVVATGIYLDDVDNLIEEESTRMQQTFDAQRTKALIIASVTVLFVFSILVVFERQINRLIVQYEAKIGDYTSNLEIISTTDSLTGACNRRKTEEIFVYQVAQSSRYNRPFSVLLMDIDKFKNINDTYGHQTGDSVLQELTSVAQNAIRDADTFGRWGGEEFLIICPELDHVNVQVLAEKIRRRVHDHTFSQVGTISCSIGTSTYHTADTLDAMLSRADNALYCAKGEGRNKVVCDSDMMTSSS